MTRLLLTAALLLASAALAHAQRMPVTTTSDAARVQLEKGVHAIAHADFARALVHFDAALAADPDFALAHMYRAVTSADRRDEHLRRAKALGARASEAERQQIASYAAQLDGDRDREVAILTALADRYPSDPLPMFIAAFSEYGRGDYAAAVAAGRRALEADPSFAQAYNAIGYAEMAAGNDAGAERAFREQIRLAPDEANPYDSYGEFLMTRDRLDEAEAEFERALARDPAFEVSRTNLARVGVMRANGAFEAAVAAGDADAVATLYTAGAVAFPPGAPPVQGREAVRELFAGMVASGVDGLSLETREVRAMGDYALEFGTGTITVGGEAGDPFSYSVLWMKDGDAWRLHRDIWNSDGPEATAGR